MRRHIFGRAVSLGASCTSKHQARRILANRQGLKIGLRDRTAVPGAPNGVFDWQVTPFPALLEYLRRDFTGMFEADDLAIKGQCVTNTRYGTIHPHEFPLPASESDLRGNYRTARSRHDYLCAKLRSYLSDDVPTLFLYSGALADDERRELESLLKSFNRTKRFTTLAAGDDSPNWEGRNDIWDLALEAFDISPAAEPKVPKPDFNITEFAASQVRRLRGHIRKMQF